MANFEKMLCRLAVRCDDDEWSKVKSALAEYADEQDYATDLMPRGRDGYEFGKLPRNGVDKEGESGVLNKRGEEIAGDTKTIEAAAALLRRQAAHRRALAQSSAAEFERDFPDAAGVTVL